MKKRKSQVILPLDTPRHFCQHGGEKPFQADPVVGAAPAKLIHRSGRLAENRTQALGHPLAHLGTAQHSGEGGRTVGGGVGGFLGLG